MKKVFIKTYGCSFNQADSENMAGILGKSGKYKIVNSEEDADVIVINSCTVKNKAESKFWKDVRNNKNKKVILAGCVPQAEKNKNKFKGYSIIGTNQTNHITEVIDETLAGNTVQLLKKEAENKINIPKVRKNSIVEIVPINEGCLGSCNFCMTKFARGYLKSYKIEDIVTHIRDALNEGAKEIWLTSQDTACYGYDINKNIVDLMNEIFKIKRDFKIRLGMGNPDFLPDYIDDFVELFKDERLFKFVHIPIQAGSDDTLKAMNRNYTVKSYEEIVLKLKNNYPDMTIATDIIVGYPNETDNDFLKTIDLVKKTKPDVVNISRFWARPGTIAAKKKLLPTEVVKERGIKLTKLCYDVSKENNNKWKEWSGRVIVDETTKKEGTSVARNYAYKPVILKKEYPLGTELDVSIIKADTHHLIGEVC